MARVHDVVTLVRTAARQIIEGRDAMLALQSEVTANGGAAWLDGGIAGANTDVTSAQITDAMFTSANAVSATLVANGNAHAGNFYRIL